jgi:hypothetical protein
MTPTPTHDQMTAHRYILQPKTRSQDDQEIERNAAALTRYANKLGASTDWTRTPEGITITIRAPRSFIWVATRERELILTSESSATAVHGAMITLMEQMDPGLVKVQPEGSGLECTGEDTCECETCERYDDEVRGELDFD